MLWLIAAIVVIGISLSVIQVLSMADKELPKIHVPFLFICMAVSSVVVLSRKETLAYVIPLLILGLISAYTEYHMKQLYDIVSIAALTLGIFMMCTRNISLIGGFGTALLFVFSLFVVRCMGFGDVLLLAAAYPYTACIMDMRRNITGNTGNDIVLFVFVLQVFVALFFSVVVNVRHLRHDVKYRTCFGPYYLASLLVFVSVAA